MRPIFLHQAALATTTAAFSKLRRYQQTISLSQEARCT